MHPIAAARRFAAGLLGFFCVIMATPALADIGTLDNVPGSTLLLPYFEVDLGNANGQTTLFSVNNATATATLTNVTLWSDDGVPVLAFNLYLVGFDVQSINVRDLLGGKLPQTASAGQDPTDTISPKGPLSQDINFASCTGILPPPQTLPQATIDDLQAAFIGHPVPGLAGQCVGSNLGDNLARGYITVDTINACNNLLPTAPNYFSYLTNQNHLWGDFSFVNPGQNFAQGDLVVSIEADAFDPRVGAPGSYTFYSPMTGTLNDHREPLGTTWVTPYLNNVGARTLAWRDPKHAVSPFACGSGEVAQHLPLPTLVATTMNAVANSPSLPADALVRVSGYVRQATEIPLPSKEGYFAWDLDYAASGRPYGGIAQSWAFTVTGSHEAGEGRFSIGVPAVQTGSAIQIPVPVPAVVSAPLSEEMH